MRTVSQAVTTPSIAHIWFAVAVGVLAAMTLGCNKTPPPESAKPAARKAPPPPVVSDDGGAYVLRYFSPTTGNLLIAKKVDDVPKGARGQVLVVPDDPKLQGPWLFVADLSAPKDGKYSARTVDRFAMEQTRAKEQALVEAATAKADGNKDEVVLYKTAWCGYCKKAARYLTLKGVPFKQLDLERDAGARADMMRRAKEAGFPASRLQGVPILYIKGRILSGFSRDAIDAALKG
ncbi:MAG: hypothetical protein KC502_04300 [Myxococcales bacterium]|nr:hypothetical protein [Myxococcales bacterium]